ncbi:CheR family methyltransferase [Leptolyngbya sp. 7M]|uniref:CheR family methyltransferase n=1 Tax=Leptolyngbya sp. 7M TaxID=2812896 RepID=UPI001B8D8AB7|nr:protein-glutamate O-methyltransferase CheR [Leptolyngbya sp. 7M]QYO62571.1 protein-glutamate O-methyltransferase CheR [Leptolyngbya sp. 7M]
MPPPNPEFEALLDYLKYNRGCDLTGYKRSTLIRRVQHRMRQLNIEDYPSYLEYLQSHINEYRALLNEVLINVTGFFRDQAVWDYLAVSLIPQIIRQQPNQVIRVWSAGCAGGQEIYSLLILLAEALGIESCLQWVQCYATDADEAALQQARQGIYSNSEVSGIRPEWLEKYFQRTESNYIFHPQLRRRIIFGRHNLTQDAPISKIDLILCRNVLIYFNPNVQISTLVRFHFALKKAGFLVLGQSETFNHHRAIFIAVNLKHRVYAKGLALDMQEHLFISPKTPESRR